MSYYLDITIEDLFIFYHVVKQKGFLRAAEALKTSQGKVSRRIGHMESMLGTTLLYRDMRNIALTETGKVVFEAAQEIVERMNRAQKHVKSKQQDLAGPITLSATSGFGNFWVMRLLPEFLAKHPDIEVMFLDHYTMGDANLMMGEADIAIAACRPDHREALTYDRLCEYSFELYASKHYLARKGVPQYVRELDHHDLIAWREPFPFYLKRELINAPLYWGRDPEHPRKARFTGESDLSMVEALNNGLGFKMMPSFMAQAASNAQQVILKDQHVFEQKEKHEKWIIYPQFLGESKKHKLLIDFIKKKAKEQFKEQDPT